MNGHLTVGALAGIPIRIHTGWLFVFALVTWSLAAGYLPAEHPGWARSTYWLVGVLASALFFASILVHELGHALVASRHGVPTRSITLFIFGGIAHAAREPATPGAEFRIAAAGPLTSLALCAVFAAIAAVTRDVAILTAPAAWLARINGMVAAFNLLPGFPLDGGRILRAVIWRWVGDFQRATAAASAVGRLLALGLMTLGAVAALGGNVVGGIWLLVLGWFLQNAAAATQAQSSMQALLRGVAVGRALRRDCARLAGKTTLDQLVREEILGAGRRCFFVTDDGRLQGLVTLHEVKAVPAERWAEVHADEVMVPADRLRTVSPDDDLLRALEIMDDANVAQLPVVANDGLLGVISREQILHYIRVRAELGR